MTAAKAAKKSSAEIQKIQEDEHNELRLYSDEMDIANSRRLCKQAAYYWVPIPQDEDDWEQSTILGRDT